jgi:hypothetical protein
MDDDWDNEEWERWIALTDAEQEQELRVAEAEYMEWYRSLTPKQRYHYEVRGLLRLIVKERKGLKLFPEMRDLMVRRAQKLLWAHRHHRQTGIYPSFDD